MENGLIFVALIVNSRPEELLAQSVSGHELRVNSKAAALSFWENSTSGGLNERMLMCCRRKERTRAKPYVRS